MDPENSFRGTIKEELSLFLSRVDEIYQQHGLSSNFSNNPLSQKLADSFMASTNLHDPLSNFLNSTLNNAQEQKMRNIFFNQSFTEASAESKIFKNELCFLSGNSSFLSHSKEGAEIKKSDIDLSSSIIPESGEHSMRKSVPERKFFLFSPSHFEANKKQQNPIESSQTPNLKEDKRQFEIYSTSNKEEVVAYSRIYGLRLASQKYTVKPYKIKLWMKAMDKEKQTRGRKPVDPCMENRVCEWLKIELENGEHITQKTIRDKAKYFSNCDSFKASKGWLEKFFRRRPQLFEAYTKNRKSLETKDSSGFFKLDKDFMKEENGLDFSDVHE